MYCQNYHLSTSYYKSFMGMFRWIIVLDRIDKSTEISTHMALSHQGQLDALLHVMSYLGLHHNPKNPHIKSEQFPVYDWSEFYGQTEEPVLPNAPEP